MSNQIYYICLIVSSWVAYCSTIFYIISDWHEKCLSFSSSGIFAKNKNSFRINFYPVKNWAAINNKMAVDVFVLFCYIGTKIVNFLEMLWWKIFRLYRPALWS